VGARRVITRESTTDKIAYQAAVKANEQDYAEVQDAVDDLGINEQFKKYPNATLWTWARQVWVKPVKRGRRKNK
jgi:hypothetical protein